MKLHTVKRTADKKNEVRRLRREGFIPAVLYVKGQPGQSLAVKADEFNAYLRQIKPGHLPTTIFSLVDDQGHERPVIIKEIQYQVTTYVVDHLDFEELIPGQKVNVKVPIECVGQVDCVGIKLGGVLRQVIRHVLVNCLSNKIPPFIELDISELGLKQSKRLSDLPIPQAVRPLVSLNEVVAVIVKR
jgi:large subunit ribosomal protein L25